jgi:Flp pilus assembly protein TadD
VNRSFNWITSIGFLAAACAGSTRAPGIAARPDPQAKTANKTTKKQRPKLKGVGPRSFSGRETKKAGNKELQSAKKKATQGDLQGAIADIKAALAVNPKLADAYLLLGSLLDLAGDSKRAATVYQKGLAAGADPAGLHHALGMLALEANDLQSTLTSLELADKLTAPPSADLKADLAYAYLLAGNTEQGLKLAQSANALDPRSFAATYILGEAHFRSKNLNAAVQYFEAALKLSPREISAQKRLAQALKQKGDFVQAETAFLRVLKLNPKDLKSQLALADLGFKLKKPAEAVKAMERALKLAPEHPQLLKLMAQTYEKAGMKSQAQAIKKRTKKVE